jgi:hypothetical protein
VAVIVVDEPLQIATPAPALMMGKVFTVTVVVAAPLHPAVVPVIVYVVVPIGFAITVAPVVADNPVPGDHV